MLFNSYPFLFIYLPVVLAGFYSFTRMRWPIAAKSWLLFSSLFFYAYWDIRFLPLLVGSILFNCGLGTILIKQQGAPLRKALLICGIVANLSLLFYFKYFNFFMNAVGQDSWVVSDLVLPIGISFFTFTQIAFLVDAYQGKVERSELISYGLFVTIFPHLIAGPILHHKEMMEQFDDPYMLQVSWPNIAQGIFLLTLGLFKKVVLADPLSQLIQPIFSEDFLHVPFIQAWFGALGYTLQLYFDFSGYSDMAVGLGLLFNLRLPINFNSPYQADSMIDFWRRWHMTLSIFLRDYLYIPMGGSRVGKWTKWRNLFLTMFLGGIWHGAGWTFLLWGACHGSFLIVNHFWREFNIALPRWLCKVCTLAAVILAWVVFRSPSVGKAFDLWQGMVGWNGVVLPEKYAAQWAFLQSYGIVFKHVSEVQFKAFDLLWVVLLLAAALYLPNSQAWMEKLKQRPLAWSVPCACLFVFTLLHFDRLAEFLYYQF